MSKLLKLESAREYEKLLYNDLLLNDDLQWGATFNFKKERLRSNSYYYDERLSDISKAVYNSINKCNVSANNVGYFIKDECQDGVWHCHALFDLSYLIKRRIPVTWFFNNLNSYWSSVPDTLKTNIKRIDDWNNLMKSCKNPRHGWMMKMDNSEGTRKLITYQSKLTKKHIDDVNFECPQDFDYPVSNFKYIPSKGLTKKLTRISKELDKPLYILERN